MEREELILTAEVVVRHTQLSCGRGVGRHAGEKMTGERSSSSTPKVSLQGVQVTAEPPHTTTLPGGQMWGWKVWRFLLLM